MGSNPIGGATQKRHLDKRDGVFFIVYYCLFRLTETDRSIMIFLFSILFNRRKGAAV